MKAIRIFLLVLIIIGVILICTQSIWVPKLVDYILSNAQPNLDYKNATYIIEGQPVTLVDGRAESAAVTRSASKIVTQYFGNQAIGDLNNDGIPDVAFILTQNGGGSGTFYYVVVALGLSNGYVGTNAVLLGDRIAPQTTEINNGELIVNYADRTKDQPMIAAPSVGISKYLKISDGRLVNAK